MVRRLVLSDQSHVYIELNGVLTLLHICDNIFMSSDYDELSAINVKENNHLVSSQLAKYILGVKELQLKSGFMFRNAIDSNVYQITKHFLPQSFIVRFFR